MAEKQEDDVQGLDDDQNTEITLVSSGDQPAELKLNSDWAKQSKLVANILEGDSEASKIQVLLLVKRQIK